MHDDHPRGRLGSQKQYSKALKAGKPRTQIDEALIQQVAFDIAIRRVETLVFLMEHRISLPSRKEVANDFAK